MHDVDLTQLAIDRGVSSPTGGRARQRVLTRYVLPIGLLAGFVALVAWSTREMLFPPKAVTVMPVLASQEGIRAEGTPLFKAAGWIEPGPTPVRVAALAPGVVEDLLVVEDQAVKKGTPVAKLIKQDSELTLQRAQADSQLRQAECEEAQALLTAATTRFEQPVHLTAALGESEASLAKIQTLLKNLPFETRRAEARREFAQSDYDRKLAAKGVVSGRSISEAKSVLASAKELVDELRDRDDSLVQERAALERRRDALKTRLDLLADEIKAKAEAEAQVKAADARLEQARVVVAEAQLRLDRMTVRAPIDGRVYKLVAHPGARIGSGMTQMQGHDGSTVVTLYRPEKLQIRVDVRFEDIPKVSLGQPVRIENAALTAPLTARVLFVSSLADIQKNTLEVKVALDDAPPVFKPEMLVDVTFLAPKNVDANAKPTQETRIHVPQSFVQQDEAGAFVWLADQSAGVARKTPIETGMSAGGMTEVTRGLTISSRLIVEGLNELQDGDRIRVTGEATHAASSGSSGQQDEGTDSTNGLSTGKND